MRLSVVLALGAWLVFSAVQVAFVRAFTEGQGKLVGLTSQQEWMIVMWRFVSYVSFGLALFCMLSWSLWVWKRRHAMSTSLFTSQQVQRGTANN